ncbi:MULTISPECIES: universal stress protein [unclassified Streptomyces]|uniref:universal stress protein n=1 Tax=unclassified Streptomyces TaxID=2593676 RepID=UPI0038063C7F
MTRFLMAGIDASRESLVAGEWAAEEAGRRGLELRLVLAVPDPADGVAEPAFALSWQRSGEEVLGRAEAALAARRPGMAMSSVQVTGSAPAALLSAARTAELLVVGARGDGGFDGLVVGSTALAAASRAPCPVVVVPRPPAAARHEAEVAVGVDARRAAEPPVEFAFDAARLHTDRLRAVHAWALTGAPPWTALAVPEEDRAAWEDEEVQRLSDVLREPRERYPDVSVLPDVVLLHPAHALVHASQRAGLLVVGRRTSPRAAEQRLGPVAHAVLHHSHCPVAVVPHD